MGFLSPKTPRIPKQKQVELQIPDPPEETPRSILRPRSLAEEQLAAQTLGTAQLGGGPVSDLNIPTFL